MKNSGDTIGNQNRDLNQLRHRVHPTNNMITVNQELHRIRKSCHNLYRVIHKSVKHFKNSQQIDYSTDHGISYADRERNSPSFFIYIYFTDAQCIHLW